MNEWENACLSSDFFCSLCLFGWHHQVPVELQWIYARILHLNTFWDLFAEIDFIFLVLNMSPSFGLSPTNLPSDPPWKRNWWNLPEVCVSTSKICCSLWKCLYDMMILLLTWMKTMIRRAESARRFIWKFNGLICCQMRSTKEQNLYYSHSIWLKMPKEYRQQSVYSTHFPQGSIPWSWIIVLELMARQKLTKDPTILLFGTPE